MHLQFARPKSCNVKHPRRALQHKKKRLTFQVKLMATCCNKLETVMYMLQSELTDAAAKHERQQNEDVRDEQHETLSPSTTARRTAPAARRRARCLPQRSRTSRPLRTR
jgi:hypothetical protein